VFVELIESLRCPNGHEDTALIASTTRTEARHIVDGTLGCPTCGAEFLIRDGILMLSEPRATTRSESASAEEAMRLAAFLELTEPRRFALLCGRWGVHAPAIGDLSSTPLVLVNPSLPPPRDVAAVVLSAANLPFAKGVARGVALDEGLSRETLASAIATVGDKGRILGPVSLPVPSEVKELTRDARVWVGEKNAAPETAPRLVSLKRAR
jgi:uncharacterized protein YbaR (Trm112 family)